MLRQPVIDATGLKARYDTELYYGMKAFVGLPGGPPPRDPLDPRASVQTDDGPDFFDAVHTQLGLELKPKKSTVDILVVDHAEKVPTEN